MDNNIYGHLNCYRNEVICPLLTMALHEETKCKHNQCAMYVLHENYDEYEETGHCGLVHPGHHNLLVNRDMWDV